MSTEPRIQQRIDKTALSHSSDHLRVYLTIYAVFFTIGISKAVVMVASKPDLHHVTAVFTLSLIGLRLLFSPEALSQFLLDFRKGAGHLPPGFVWFYPLLLLQAALIYLACYEFSSQGIVDIVPVLLISALGVNVAWLLMMLALAWMYRLDHFFVPARRNRLMFWAINNLFFAGLAAAVLVFSESDDRVLTALALLLLGSLFDLGYGGTWYLPKARHSESQAERVYGHEP